MNIVKYQPESIIRSIFKDWDDLWSDPEGLWSNFLSTRGSERFLPLIDVVENEKFFVLKADLPGLTKEDIKVDVNENILTIKGERKQEKENKSEKYYTMERRYGSFQRSFTLPEVEKEKITANFKDGVLEIMLPKAETTIKKQLTINVD